MSSRLMVNGTNQLREVKEPGDSPGLRLLAKFISYALHPVFIPVYILLFLLYIHPSVFTGFTEWKKTLVFLQGVVGYVVFPVVTVLLLKALNFIDSIYLFTQKDRVIPFIACGIWYFWAWYVWRNLPDSPEEIVVLSMAIFLASSMGLIINIYMKISLHAIAMGVMISFMISIAITHAVSFSLYLSIAFLIVGLVCTARFIVSDHTQKEIYGGLFCGVIALLIGNWIH